MPARDLLDGVAWECGATPPGAVGEPCGLAEAEVTWLPAAVPGTAAGALRAAGRWQWGVDDEELLDGQDWWFRCRLAATGDVRADLELDGLATLADVWLDGEHLLTSGNMFLGHRVPVVAGAGEHELVLRFAALAPVLAARHRRPRWKSLLVRDQSLRWHRTTLLGRMPGWASWGAPVGPWRPIRLLCADAPRVLGYVLHTSCVGAGGHVAVRASLQLEATPAEVRLEVGSAGALLSCERSDTGELVVSGGLELPAVERWWPHTHGTPTRYAAHLVVDGVRLELRPVGFRTVAVDRTGGGFALSVNGVALFARGACWGPPDAIGLAASPEAVHASVELARDANLNLLRLPGYTLYEEPAFWDACDELGVLVWQDCMLASFDPPDDEGFWHEEVRPEIEQLLDAVGDRPALAVLCGSSETYQQASMYGFGAEDWSSRLLEERIPEAAAERAPGIPYVASSPSGGARPFAPDEGISHYFGVGAYLRPVADAQLSSVRFASECLAFANPPERATVREAFGPVSGVGHDPRWKAGAARDASSSWDFEDVRDHYVRELFGVEPLDVRYSDPERALDLGRAVVCELTEAVISRWRRPASSCAGAIVLCWQDLWPGAGWGFVDAAGRPKPPLHAMRRACAPLTVRILDDGLSGLKLLVLNDRGEPFAGSLALSVHLADGSLVERAERPVDVPPADALELGADDLLGGFRDLNRAYRFSPPTYDLVHAELRDAAGAPVADAHFLPEGPGRPRSPDLGLAASLRQTDSGWAVELSCRRFVQYAQLDVPGYRPDSSWLHLAPGARAEIGLRAVDGHDAAPAGVVRALNAVADVRIAGEA